MQHIITLTAALVLCYSTSTTTLATTATTPITNTGILNELITQTKWEGFFPSRHKLYTYEGLEDAEQKYYPLFLNEGNLTTRKIELAAFMAQTAHESGDYMYIKEIDPKSNYCAEDFGCIGDYYGRGPMQLTWNFNYAKFSADILQTDYLLQHPERLLDNSTMIWTSAIWYWMTVHDGQRDSIHNLFVQRTWPAFSNSTFIINGAVECGCSGTQSCHPSEDNRVQNFLKFSDALGVTVGSPEKLSCQTQDFDFAKITIRCGKTWIEANVTWGQECHVNSCPAVNNATAILHPAMIVSRIMTLIFLRIRYDAV